MAERSRGERERLLAKSAAYSSPSLSGRGREVMGSPAQRRRPAVPPAPPAGAGRGLSEDTKGVFLLMIFVVFVIVSLGNRIFQKLQTIPMYNYPCFLNVLTTAVYVPVSFAYIVPMIRYGSAISKEQTQIPKYKFAIMGTLDCLASAMQIFAVNFISNASILVLLQQSAIPISMAISKVSLNASYKVTEYLGALIVCCGIVVVLLPQLTGGGADDSNGHNQILWAIVNIISCIPMALSSVYKEKALQGQDIDVVYLNGWVALFQFVLSIPMSIPSAMAMNLPLEDLPGNLLDGLSCFLGHSSVYETQSAGLLNATTWLAGAASAVTSSAPMPQDHCAKAPLYVSLYIMFNLAYNILIVVILKYGSSNIMYMGSTALVPLTNAAFSIPLFPGHKPVKPTDLAGLVVIMSGITTYRFSEGLLRCLGIGSGAAMPVKPGKSPVTAQRLENETSREVVRRTALYVGLNQGEILEPLMESRVRRATSALRLARSPAQIRSSYLLRLGMPPSPKVARSPDNGMLQRSPPFSSKGYADTASRDTMSLNV